MIRIIVILLALFLVLASSTTETSSNGNNNIKLSLKVLGYNRPSSLSRLLRSLVKADYPPEADISVDIYLDAAKQGSWRREKDFVRRNRDVALDFGKEWPFGKVNLHVRSKNAGLAHQWFESWYPITDNEYTLVLEDDLEVSKHYYTWLNDIVKFYRYPNPDDSTPLNRRIAGVTLQRARVIAAQAWSPFDEAEQNNLPLIYGFQQPGSWGQLFFPEHWREFRQWLEAITGDADTNHDDARPFRLAGSPSHTGSEGSFLNSEWTGAWMKFIYERGYFVLYSHPPGEYVLCLNHLEPGEHYKEQGVVIEHLVENLNINGQSLLDFPAPSDLAVYNIWGIEINTKFNYGELLEYPGYNDETYKKGLLSKLSKYGGLYAILGSILFLFLLLAFLIQSKIGRQLLLRTVECCMCGQQCCFMNKRTSGGSFDNI